MRDHNKETGVLYIVATPIGNLQDITFRAVEVLKKVTRIATEDTRHTARLLNHFSINKPSISLHNFNEKLRTDLLLSYLQAGEDLALVSDAGTPLISDPGFHVVKAAKLQNIRVVPVPGPCAFITALCASGIPCDRFTFEGFLNAKSNSRRQQLSQLVYETRTMIFYEAPHRLIDSLQDLAEILGEEREAAIARELTKVHEIILMNKIKNLLTYYIEHAKEQKGEIVIIVAGAREKPPTIGDSQQILSLLLESLSLKKAVEVASKITGARKNDLYQLALQLKKNN